MKVKPFNYFNVKTMDIKYGIQVKHDGKWMPCAENGRPLMFDTEDERDKRMKQLRG